MGGGSKTQTTTQETKSDPWAPAQPALQVALKGALDAYNSGQGSQVYTGDRIAGLGRTTQAGLDWMLANAGAGNAAAQAGNNGLTTLLQNGGATAGTTSATNGILGVGPVSTAGVQSAADRMGNPNSAAAQVGNSLVGGKYAQDASGYQNLANGLGQTTQTQRSLTDVASGKYLQEGGNPYADAIAGESAAQAAAAVRNSFAANGRYGSGRFASATGDAVARAENEARYSNYNFERQQQAQAAGAIDSQANARTSSLQSLFDAMNGTRTANAGQAVTGAGLASQADQAALTGANAVAALQGQNNQQQIGQYTAALGSAQSDRAAQLAAMGQVGTNNENLLQPGRTLAQVGAIQDAARQEQLDSQQGIFNEQQAQQWKQLGLLSGLVNPIAGLGGTTNATTTQTIPQASGLQQVLGAMLAAAGTASKFVKPTPI